jgi:hypothetical protein
VIEGLERVGSVESSALAHQLAARWLESNHLGWANTGLMYEKYSADIPGARGEGGEYYPQVRRRHRRRGGMGVWGGRPLRELEVVLRSASDET